MTRHFSGIDLCMTRAVAALLLLVAGLLAVGYA